MNVKQILQNSQAALSFEVFPPKNEAAFATVRDAARAVCALHPAFISVTCGAGGSTDGYTGALAAELQKDFCVPAVAHLTCVNAAKDKIRQTLSDLAARGIRNVLALRGDLPDGVKATAFDFPHAADLVREIRAAAPDMTVGCAAYPEGHPESPSQKEDIRRLCEKVAAGCDFMTTQMFFDNNVFYNFLYKVRDAGVTVPVVAGVMPVTNAIQITRICKLSGTVLPPRFARIVDRYGHDPAAMKQAGIAYATEQIIDLYANGVRAVHLYSMNKPDVAAAIQSNLSVILTAENRP